LAALTIVAVVIIMAALAVEVKASPVFDRANLKEERQILLESVQKLSEEPRKEYAAGVWLFSDRACIRAI
jgi:hypothetical protein